MAENSKIEWTHHTFNPWVGCQRVSPGCEHCYAEALDKRVGGALVDGVKQLRWGPKAPRVRTSAQNWKLPLKWNRKAQEAGERHRVFCASLADVFEQLVPGQLGALDAWRLELFELIRVTPHLDWLLLTKRPQLIMHGLVGAIDAYARTPGCSEAEAMLQRWVDGEPPLNVWLGTTVEDQQRANERIPVLLRTPAVVRFLSCEPLLEHVNLVAGMHGGVVREPATPAGRIDWIIIGGESGGRARRFEAEWARSLAKQARAMGAAPFVKQMGANVIDRNDAGFNGDDEEGWHSAVEYGGHIRVEHDLDGYRDDYQGAPVRVHLRDHHGGDMAEWPADLRVREFPTPRTP